MTGLALLIEQVRKLTDDAAQACWALTATILIPAFVGVFAVFRLGMHAAHDITSEHCPALSTRPALVVVAAIGTALVVTLAAAGFAVIAGAIVLLALLWTAPLFIGLKLIVTAFVIGATLAFGVLLADELDERFGVSVSLDDVFRRQL